MNADRVIAISAAIFAGLTGAFAGWQAYEARETRFEAKRQAEIARQDAARAAEQARQDADRAMRLQTEQSKAAAHQAGRSANAAERSNALAKQALQITEAAFIDAACALKQPLAENQHIQVISTLRNAGRTAAYQVLAKLRIVYGPFTEDQAYDIAWNGPEPKGSSRSFMSPGSTSQQVATSSIMLNAEYLEGVRNKRNLIFAFGRIDFQDAFQIDHRTEYCFVHNPDHEQMDLCAGHNLAK